jgi:hypothetical protein
MKRYFRAFKADEPLKSRRLRPLDVLYALGRLSPVIDYLTVTAFVRCLGLSGSSPRSIAM